MCSVSGCDRPAVKVGLCYTHYRWQRQGRDLTTPIRPKRSNQQTCDICGNPHWARGLCVKHLHRLRRHGDPLAGGPEQIRDSSDRFKANIAPGSNGCWVWTGSLSNKGYGIIQRDGHYLAHRWSYERYFGSIPDGLEVCHSCDNPACIMPTHLFLGTHQDNFRDMVAKGRGHWQRGHSSNAPVA